MTSVLRHGQPSITRVLPHIQNRRWALGRQRQVFNNVIAVGDSNFKGGEGAFPNLIGVPLAPWLSPRNTFIEADAGRTLETMAADVDTYIAAHPTADSMCLMGGSNDIYINAPIATLAELQGWVNDIRDACLTARLALCICVIPPTGKSAEWTQAKQDLADEFADWLRGLRGEGYPIAEVYDAVLDRATIGAEPAIITEFNHDWPGVNDWFHFTQLGADHAAAAIDAAMSWGRSCPIARNQKGTKPPDLSQVNAVENIAAVQHSLATPFTGNAFTWSCWFQSDNLTATEWRVWMAALASAGSSNRTFGSRESSNRMRTSAASAVPVTIAIVESTNFVAQAVTHVVVSVDCSTGAYLMFINGVDVSNIVTDNSPDTMDWRDNLYLWSRPADFTAAFLGTLAEFWMADVFTDLTDSDELAKFITPGGEPADLGARGENPNGSIPDMYLGGDMKADTGGFIAGPGGADTGWNGGCNNGAATITAVVGTWTDVTPIP